MELERETKVGKGGKDMVKSVADGMLEMRREIMQTMTSTAPMIKKLEDKIENARRGQIPSFDKAAIDSQIGDAV